MDTTQKVLRGECLLSYAEKLQSDTLQLCEKFVEFYGVLLESQEPRDALAAEELQMAIRNLQVNSTVIGTVEHFTVRALESIERRKGARVV